MQLLALALLAPLAAALAPRAAPSGTKPSVNPVGLPLHDPAQRLAAGPLPAPTMSNAQRMARGLAPNPPRRKRAGAAPAQPSGTPPKSYMGHIQVVNATSGSPLGFISKTLNQFGEYGLVSAAPALDVSFVLPAGDAAFAIATPGGALPFLGAVAGYSNLVEKNGGAADNLDTSSFNYAYLVGANVLPEAPAVAGVSTWQAATDIAADVESAIWTFDTTSKAVKPKWTNVGGGHPKTSALYYAPDNVLVLTGDAAAFESTFADAAGEATPVTFVLVPS